MYRQTDRQAGGVALTASLDRQLQLTLAVSLDVFARQSLFFIFSRGLYDAQASRLRPKIYF